MEMDETWGYAYQEGVLQGYISDFVWVGLVTELGGLENAPTLESCKIPGLGISFTSFTQQRAALPRS